MATIKKLSRSQGRAKVNRLDKLMPNEKRNCIIRPISMDHEIANIRRQAKETSDPIDTSALGWMLPHNRQKIARELASARGGRLNWRTNKKDREELIALLKGAAEPHDTENTRELASYRTFEITSDLLATPFALSPFQSINLSGDELPQIITPKTRQYFEVTYMGQDGGARRDQWRTTKRAEEMEMRLVSTPRVEYPLVDLQQGSVVEFDKINAQMRWDMEYKIENLALESLNNSLMANGIRDLIQIHPDIDETAIPDTNILDLRDVPTYGTANVWTVTRLKALLNHFAQWGFGFDPDGPISLQTMIMSPKNARDSWDYVDLVSGYDSTFGEDQPSRTITSQQREQIMSSGGLMNSAWGYNWNTQFNPRVVKGEAWCFTNQPVGWYFTKTEMDRTIEWKDDPDSIEQNIGQILFRKALQFYQPSLWAYRYLKVLF
jgi:hypothetical protein